MFQCSSALREEHSSGSYAQIGAQMPETMPLLTRAMQPNTGTCGVQAVGAKVLRPPMGPEASPDGARAALEAAGFTDIAVTLLKARRTFETFADYWDLHCLPIALRGHARSARTAHRWRRRNGARHNRRRCRPAAAPGAFRLGAIGDEINHQRRGHDVELAVGKRQCHRIGHAKLGGWRGYCLACVVNLRGGRVGANDGLRRAVCRINWVNAPAPQPISSQRWVGAGASQSRNRSPIARLHAPMRRS